MRYLIGIMILVVFSAILFGHNAYSIPVIRTAEDLEALSKYTLTGKINEIRPVSDAETPESINHDNAIAEISIKIEDQPNIKYGNYTIKFRVKSSTNTDPFSSSADQPKDFQIGEDVSVFLTGKRSDSGFANSYEGFVASKYVVSDGIAYNVTSTKQEPPLKQLESGIHSRSVNCNDGLELLIKESNGQPACVTSETKQKLIERGWAGSSGQHDPYGDLTETNADFPAQEQYLFRVTNYLGDKIDSSTFLNTPLEFHFNLTNHSEDKILRNVTFGIVDMDHNEIIYKDTKRAELEPGKFKILEWSYAISSEGNYKAFVYHRYIPQSVAKSFIVEDPNDYNHVTVKILQGASDSDCIQERCLEPSILNVTTGTAVDFVNLDSHSHEIATGNVEFFPEDSIEYQVFFDHRLQSPHLSTNDTYSYLFLTPGEYNYFSMRYPHVNGTIIVSPGPYYIDEEIKQKYHEAIDTFVQSLEEQYWQDKPFEERKEILPLVSVALDVRQKAVEITLHEDAESSPMLEGYLGIIEGLMPDDIPYFVEFGQYPTPLQSNDQD